MDDVLMNIENELSTRKYTEIVEFYKEHNRSIDSSFYLFSGRKRNEKFIKRGEIIDRKPKDIDRGIQKAFDRALVDLGFDALRSNSVFCTGNPKFAQRYGNLYIVFPANGFSITWSTKVDDLYLVLRYKKITLETLNFVREKREFVVTSPQGIETTYILWFVNDKLKEFLRKLKEINIETKHDVHSYNNIQDVVKGNPGIFDFTDREKRHLYDDFLEVLKHYATPKKDVEMNSKDDYEKYYEIFHYIIQKFYRNDSLYDAIKSKNEIMVHAKSYLFIDAKFFMDNRDLILSFGMR